MRKVNLHQLLFDPRTIDRETSSSMGHGLVLLTREPSKVLTSQLARLGCKPTELMSSRLLLCEVSPADLENVDSLDVVRWTRPYDRRFKIAPDLRAEPKKGLELSPNRPLAMSDEVVAIRVQFHRGLDVARFREAISKAGGVAPSEVDLTGGAAILSLRKRFIEHIARLDAVRWIAPLGAATQSDIRSRDILNADVVINGTPFRGAGEKICVSELGGFDLGSTTDVHPAFSGRVNSIYTRKFQNSEFVYLPVLPADATDVAGWDNHGTHVSGCALARGVTNTQELVEGTAPDARLVFLRMLQVPANLSSILQPPYVDEGVRIHTNSWTEKYAGYSPLGDQIDSFVWNNPDMLVCVAAGNDTKSQGNNKGLSTERVFGPAQAKNALTIGASESDRAGRREGQGKFPATYSKILPGFDDPPYTDNLIADNAEGIAAFSSRGPAEGARYKPEVVAPGTSILSASSRKANPEGDLHGFSGDPVYCFMSGTSMAAPAVAGCAAVLREFLTNRGLTYIPASLIKAMLINGARSLSGQFSPAETAPMPNNVCGWGLIDLAGSILEPGPESGIHIGGPLEEGQEERFTISIHGSTLKVTIAWTDPPGAHLQNDLDLIVIAADGTERHGNMGITSDFDRTNNVEQVVWPAIPQGDQTVIVRAHRILQFPQAYSLAWHVTHP